MALSNWLTRNEWNACYFAGLKEQIDGKPCEGLGDQLCLGIGLLCRAGYVFTGIEATRNGGYRKVRQCCGGNEAVLAELMGANGGFDAIGRAQEAIAFVATALPDMDWSWLSDLLDAERTAEP